MGKSNKREKRSSGHLNDSGKPARKRKRKRKKQREGAEPARANHLQNKAKRDRSSIVVAAPSYQMSTKVKSTRRDGESMTAYKRRLKQEMRDFLADEIRNQKHVKAKAKHFFKEKARKQKHKKEKKINAREVRHLQRSVSDLVTAVPFGEVNAKPPDLAHFFRKQMAKKLRRQGKGAVQTIEKRKASTGAQDLDQYRERVLDAYAKLKTKREMKL